MVEGSDNFHSRATKESGTNVWNGKLMKGLEAHVNSSNSENDYPAQLNWFLKVSDPQDQQSGSGRMLGVAAGSCFVSLARRRFVYDDIILRGA